MHDRHSRATTILLWLLAACSSSVDNPDAAVSGSSAGAYSAPSAECEPNLACQLDAPPSSGDPHQDCVDRINQFRVSCACLEPLERWTDGEDCADDMAAHDATENKAHDGFIQHICAPNPSAQNECPNYHGSDAVVQRCLQSMWNEGPPPQAACDGSCFQAHGHYINMTNPRYERVACGFADTQQGTVWSVQNFSP